MSLVQYLNWPSSLSSLRRDPGKLDRLPPPPLASEANPDMVLTDAEEDDRRLGYGAKSSGYSICMPAASNRFERRSCESTYLEVGIPWSDNVWRGRVHSYSHHHSSRARGLTTVAPAPTRSLLGHQINGQLAGELDEAVVASFRDDEDGLDVGADFGAAWQTR